MGGLAILRSELLLCVHTLKAFDEEQFLPTDRRLTAASFLIHNYLSVLKHTCMSSGGSATDHSKFIGACNNKYFLL